jgi:cyclophilin family peptidyl-prolyl cis-trans isomerase
MKYIPFLILSFALFACNSSSTDNSEDHADSDYTNSDTMALEQDLVQEPVRTDSTDENRVKVKIATVHGDLICVLYNETPKHRDNFIKLVKDNFYDDLLFHRVIKGFMIQGGDPKSRGAALNTQLGDGGPGYTIEAELNPKLYHKKGALCAARQGDHVNPNKNSSGSQFYIVQGQVYGKEMFGEFFPPEIVEDYSTIGGTPQLDMQYTVFGEVVEGLDIIDKIGNAQTHQDQLNKDRPLQDVKMTVTLLE